MPMSLWRQRPHSLFLLSGLRARKSNSDSKEVFPIFDEELKKSGAKAHCPDVQKSGDWGLPKTGVVDQTLSRLLPQESKMRRFQKC